MPLDRDRAEADNDIRNVCSIYPVHNVRPAMGAGVEAMAALNVTQARHKFASLVDRVEHHGERIVLQRHGRDVVALIPADELRLLDALEDRFDIEQAVRLLGEKHREIPFDKAMKELGLD